jgi:ABC-type amino acid transport system permease subunit
MGFFRSTTGRLMALSIAVAFILGGISALMHHGVESTFVLCLSLFAPIVINTVALPQALEKDWYHAALSVMILPMLFFLWAVGIGAIREHHPWIAYPAIVAGLGALAVAIRPSAPAAEHALLPEPVAQH